jgi:hypothetical protein
MHANDLARFALLKRINVEPRLTAVRRILAHLVPYLVQDNVGGGYVLVRLSELLGEQLANALLLHGELALQVHDAFVRRLGN